MMLSADLFDLINESQSMFEEVSKIQVPSLVPFENYPAGAEVQGVDGEATLAWIWLLVKQPILCISALS